MSAPAYIRRESGSEKRTWAAEPAGVPGLQRAVVVLIRPSPVPSTAICAQESISSATALRRSKPFWLRQTADAHAEGNFTIDGETELLLQRLLVRRFAVRVGIVVHERLVLRGIVGNGVDAV